MFKKVWNWLCGMYATAPVKEKLVGYVKPGGKGRYRLFVDALDGEKIAMSNPRGTAQKHDAFRRLERLRDAEIEIRYE